MRKHKNPSKSPDRGITGEDKILVIQNFNHDIQKAARFEDADAEVQTLVNARKKATYSRPSSDLNSSHAVPLNSHRKNKAEAGRNKRDDNYPIRFNTRQEQLMIHEEKTDFSKESSKSRSKSRASKNKRVMFTEVYDAKSINDLKRERQAREADLKTIVSKERLKDALHSNSNSPVPTHSEERPNTKSTFMKKASVHI